MAQHGARRAAKAHRYYTPEEFETMLDEQIDRNQKLLDENGMLLNFRQAPQYRHLSPKAMGILDRLDGLECRPSVYYCRRKQIIGYILGYISIAPEDEDAKILGGMYNISETDIQDAFDAAYEESQEVDESQSERCDWRRA